MKRTYRDNGAYGALLDEYERALEDLYEVIAPVDNDSLAALVDNETKDEDCRSIQSILTHVVQSGFTYAITIRKHQGEEIEFREKVTLQSVEEYIFALREMMAYTIQMMKDYPNMNLNESDNAKKFLTRWGQMYNAEQLLEHAIVHVLRHRRQIERFILKL